MTSVRRQILRNIYEGRDPYDGFTGPRLGGAIHSLHFWYDGPLYIQLDQDGKLWLTPAGVAALEDA